MNFVRILFFGSHRAYFSLSGGLDFMDADCQKEKCKSRPFEDCIQRMTKFHSQFQNTGKWPTPSEICFAHGHDDLDAQFPIKSTIFVEIIRQDIVAVAVKNASFSMRGSVQAEGRV